MLKGLLFVVTILAVATAVAHCQVVEPGFLPDAPSASTCVSHGKPCPEWLHKLIGPYPVPPDQVYDWMKFDTAPAGLFTFRKLGAPVLHPNKKCWALFIATHAAAWTALAVTNHHVEHWDSEGPALAAVTGLDLIAFKLISPSLAMGAPVYSTVHYLNAR